MLWPDTYVSPTPAEMEAGFTNPEFAGDYQPMGVEDILTVKYIWFDEEDTTDLVYIFVNFNTKVERSLAITNDDGEFVNWHVFQVEGWMKQSLFWNQLG